MKTTVVWLSGILFGLGLACLTLYANDVACNFHENGYFVCVGKRIV